VDLGCVNATDGDGTERNRGVNFFIESGSSGKFSIDPKTGCVYVQVDAQLDFESVSVYNLTILAVDQGSPPLNSTSEFLVNVLDVNDVAPEFDRNARYQVQVLENMASGSIVFDCNATDVDTDSHLRYSIIGISAYDEDRKQVDSATVWVGFQHNSSVHM